MKSEGSQSDIRYSRSFFLFAVVIHIVLLFSLFSEPWRWEHDVNLTGSRSHPSEDRSLRGFLDPFFHDSDRVVRGLDFFSIYQSGYNFTHRYSVYYGVRNHRNPDLLIVPYFSGFRYLPVYAYSFGVMLTAVEPWTSYWLWIIIVEAMYMLNLLFLFRFTAPLKYRYCAAAAWLAFSPYYVEIHIGQQSMVTATLLNLMLIHHLKSRPAVRDGLYILSVIWKINTLLLLPVFVRWKRWRSIIILFASIIALSAPYFIIVPGSFQEFISYFRVKFVASGPSSMGFWTLIISLWQKLGTTFPWIAAHQEIIRSMLSGWNLIIAVMAGFATFFSWKTRFVLPACMWICSYFLTYQFVWEHHYVMMLPVISILILVYRNFRWLLYWFFIAIPTPYVFFNNPDLPMPQSEWDLITTLLYHGIKVIPVLVLFMDLFLLCLHRRAVETDLTAD